MIRGFFPPEASGRRRPFVIASVVCPPQGLSGEVAFLIDSGADSTLLSPTDAAALGVDYRRLLSAPPVQGVGGRVPTFHIEAVLTLGDSRVEVAFRVLQRRRDLMRLPSLLGRDILERAHLSLVLDPSSRVVLLLNAEEMVRLRQTFQLGQT